MAKRKLDAAKTNDIDSFETPAVPVFGVGKWKGKTYSTSDLDDMVANFQRHKANHQPPLILGHDEKEKTRRAVGMPKLGKMSDLIRVGKKLVAKFVNVPRELLELIRAGHYEDISVGIYPDGFPDHPETRGNGAMMRHVGILGDEIPHLKILGQPLRKWAAMTLGEDLVDDEFVTVSFSEADLAGVDYSEIFADEEPLIQEAKQGILFVVARPKGKTTTMVQSIIFDLKRWSPEKAIEWLREHNKTSEKMDRTAVTLRFRQEPPEDFEQDSFRIIEPGSTQSEDFAETALSKKLKELSMAIKLNTADLAKAVDALIDGDMPTATMEKILNGDFRPFPPIIAALAKALDVPLKSLTDLSSGNEEQSEGDVSSSDDVRDPKGGSATRKDGTMPKKKEMADDTPPKTAQGSDTADVKKPEEIKQEETKTPETKASDAPETKAPAMTATEAEALRNKMAEMEKTIKEQGEVNARLQEESAINKEKRIKAEVSGFCEKLKIEGKYLPVFDERGAQKFMIGLANDETEPEQFSENGEKQDRLTWFKEFLSNLPKVVEFNELAKAEEKRVAGNHPEGATEKSVALTELADKYIVDEKAKGNEVDFAEAASYIARTHQELA